MSLKTPAFIKESFTPPSKDDGRLPYIDLMKGIVIILVVLGHNNLNGAIADFFGSSACGRMPMYFFLSGFFFSTYDSHSTFLRKKANNLLVPLVLWLLLSFVIRNLLSVFVTHRGFIPIFVGYDEELHSLHINGSLWFLFCLFISNALFYLISKAFNGKYICLSVIVLALFANLCRELEWHLHLWIDSACLSMPFFYFGYLIRNADLDRFKIFSNPIACLVIGALLFAVSALIFYTFEGPYLIISYNLVHSNPILAYINSFIWISALYFVCRAINWLPVISYFGKYSIIVLCSHLMLQLIMFVITFDIFGWPFRTFYYDAVLLMMCWITIPFCRKFLPHVCAQKPLLPIKLKPIKIPFISFLKSKS